MRTGWIIFFRSFVSGSKCVSFIYCFVVFSAMVAGFTSSGYSFLCLCLRFSCHSFVTKIIMVDFLVTKITSQIIVGIFSLKMNITVNNLSNICI